MSIRPTFSHALAEYAGVFGLSCIESSSSVPMISASARFMVPGSHPLFWFVRRNMMFSDIALALSIQLSGKGGLATRKRFLVLGFFESAGCWNWPSDHHLTYLSSSGSGKVGHKNLLVLGLSSQLSADALPIFTTWPLIEPVCHPRIWVARPGLDRLSSST